MPIQLKRQNYDINDLKSYAKEKGGECLSDFYVNSYRTKYRWKCNEGHKWRSCWSNIKHSNRWCPICAIERVSQKKRKYDIKDVKRILEPRNIEFLSKNYKNKVQKYKLKCLKCGFVWRTKFYHVESGSGCPKCAKCAKKTIKDMHKLAKRRGFQFLSKTYINCETYCEWKCPNGHTWEAKSINIQNGKGCSKCRNNTTEEKCRFIFESLTNHKFPTQRNLFGNYLQLDGYCKELNLAFEYQGEQHYEFIKYIHKTKTKFLNQLRRDKLKKQKCRENNIKLIIIPFLEAHTDKQLECFIRKSLVENKINIMSHEIQWNKYKNITFKLKEIIKKCEKRGIEYLSGYYPGHHYKAKLNCKKCDFEWETRICCLKRGHGCPKCGHIKSWEKRRLSISFFDAQWSKKYRRLKRILSRGRNYPNYRNQNSELKQLGTWIVHQKSIYRKNKIKEKRRQKLEKLKNWSWA